MNFTDLLAAICLVFIIEGLLLLVAPQAWKRLATHLLTTTDLALRIGGGLMIAAGLVALQLMRAA
jgi:uncharacterized protein YjeT (DUF2065 family)